MKKVVLAVLVLGMVQGCSSEVPDVKSPCVGLEGSPCGARTPVNGTWLETMPS